MGKETGFAWHRHRSSVFINMGPSCRALSYKDAARLVAVHNEDMRELAEALKVAAKFLECRTCSECRGVDEGRPCSNEDPLSVVRAALAKAGEIA